MKNRYQTDNVSLRLPTKHKEILNEIAINQEKHLSQLIRDLLVEYIDYAESNNLIDIEG